MSRRGWTSHNPMFETIADGMLIQHAERVALSSVMLQALAEKHPETWGNLVQKIQDLTLRGYESGNVKILADALAGIERLYRSIAKDHGMDPDTGERIGG